MLEQGGDEEKMSAILKMIATLLILLPSLLCEKVLASYMLSEVWEGVNYETIATRKVYTTTECILKCGVHVGCQKVGVKDVDGEKKECLLLKKKRIGDENVTLATVQNNVALITQVCSY